MNQKIVVSEVADQQLDEMFKIVNDGFSSGRVKKTELASWIISYFRESLFSKQIEKIRADHFDEIAHMESVVEQLKQAKKSKETLELNKLLMPCFNKNGTKKQAVKDSAEKFEADPVGLKNPNGKAFDYEKRD